MRWFARTEQLLGSEGFARLRQASVAVYGLGGVGSSACEALVRAGIGHLRVVDHDVVNPSNINRQLFALHSTIGRAKVEVASERIRDINPDCQVDARRAFINGDSVAELLEPRPDLIVDAIDSVNAKAALLEAAYEREIPIISSMGAGGRKDGSQIAIGDLSESFNCPLARMIRKRLSKRGIRQGILCVYTPEPCRNDLLPLPEDRDAHVGPGRVRMPLGTISYMPALFGLRVAEEAIRMLLEDAPCA